MDINASEYNRDVILEFGNNYFFKISLCDAIRLSEHLDELVSDIEIKYKNVINITNKD